MQFGKTEKGVAGMNILISVLATVFLVGILVSLFAITGNEFMDATDDATAIETINDTSNAIADVTDWLPIIIIITAIVVIILLVTLIIGAIRGAGMMQGE